MRTKIKKDGRQRVFSFAGLLAVERTTSRRMATGDAVRSTAFNFQYPLASLRSSSSCLCRLPCIPSTSIPPLFPSITCFRRQFLHNMQPIQHAYLLYIVCKIFLCSLTLRNTSSFVTQSVQLMFSILFQHHISKLSSYFRSTFRSVHVSAPYKRMLQM